MTPAKAAPVEAGSPESASDLPAAGHGIPPADPTPALTDLAQCVRLSAGALRSGNENDLQLSIALLLQREGHAAEREKILGPGERLDFFLPRHGIAIEVKIAGTTGDLERQVRRYLGYPEVLAVLVVTTRARHRDLPRNIAGRPVRVAWIGRPY